MPSISISMVRWRRQYRRKAVTSEPMWYVHRKRSGYNVWSLGHSSLPALGSFRSSNWTSDCTYVVVLRATANNRGSKFLPAGKYVLWACA